MSNNRIEVKYDDREDEKFINLLRRELPTFSFIRTRLPVCDYIINEIPIELKRDGDYISSMIGDRLNNQLANMSYNFEFSYLVIIGHVYEAALAHNIRRSAVTSSLLGDSFRRYPGGKGGVVVTVQLEYEYDFCDFIKYLSSKERARLPRLTKLSVPKEERLIATVASFKKWGPTLAKTALKKFGSIEGIINAGEEKLQTLYDCGPVRARSFYEHLKERFNE